ncbi:MAG: NAD(P)-binding domain-containing protein, partial [Phycisphaerales bacterium]|nr:NAD(P)-binding domain-containing protein [Phycisphaerales bacterium]
MTSLIFIGGGNMAEALLRGGLKAGVLGADAVHVADPTPERRAVMASIGVTVHESATDAVHAAPLAPIVLAVKPQMLRAVHRDTGVLPDRAIISILAGTPVAKIRDVFGTPRVVRVMPNTPARLGRGMSAIARGAGAL